MITWQGFSAGIIAALVVYAMIRAALWIANSRTIPEPLEDAPGDWPHMGGR